MDIFAALRRGAASRSLVVKVVRTHVFPGKVFWSSEARQHVGVLLEVLGSQAMGAGSISVRALNVRKDRRVREHPDFRCGHLGFTQALKP